MKTKEIFNIVNFKKNTSFDSVLVGLSMGKDSLATLDICSKIYKKVIPFYLYIHPDLRHVKEKMEEVEDKYNVKVLKYPHVALSILLNASVYRIGYQGQTPKYNHLELYNYIRKDTSVDYIAVGIKTSDSMIRSAMIKSLALRGIDHKRRILYPIYNYKKNDVLDKCKEIGIKPLTYKGKVTDGLNVDYETLKWMIDNGYEDDYKKITKIFPLAKTLIETKKMFPDNKTE